jgi:putative peptide zinc metalloprotease protein
MSHAIHRRLAVLFAAALCAALPSPAVAQGDTAAVAVNTKDESSIFKLAFNIRRVTGDVVDQTNAAVAVASCEECRTVAIAIQVLIVQTDPSVVTPENLALAVNVDCTLCETFALAYQLVIGEGTRLRFTADGNRQIAQIRRELRALRREDLSGAELDARVDALVDRLRGVLATELVGVGRPADPTELAREPEQPAQPPADSAPTQTAPAQTTPAQTTPEQPPAQTTPAQPPAQTTTPAAPADTTTAPAPSAP